MDDLYRSFHYSSSCPTTPTIGHIDFVGDGIIHQDQNMITSATAAAVQQYCLVSHDHDDDEDDDNEGGGFIKRSSNDDVIKAQIANHPLYPTLLSSYIDCTKVGAPPEMTSVLEEISEENRPTFVSSTEIGTDPELDHFMKSYCDALHKYKEELSKPFDEATNFLSSIGSQLTDLCKEILPSTNTYSHHHSSTAEWEEGMMMRCGGGEVVEGGLKEMVMRKYSGYVSSLRKEMLKKRKKGKLPKLAISALLDWWNTHYRWPYPTEEEKSRLSEMTGLDLKQINNWFINQRKRYWRPSEDMRSALMEGVAAAAVDDAAAASAYFHDMTSS